jgi:hypothetical protein
MTGAWLSTRSEAMSNALLYGQAKAGIRDRDAIVLRDFATIQTRPSLA